MAENVRLITNNAETFRDFSEKQMRAYLSVNIGGATYQELAKNLKFEGKPIMLNTGHTPAHRVRFRAAADILPIPLASDFSFPLPVDENGSGVLNPQQTFAMSAVVQDYVEEADVAAVKMVRENRGLYTWGRVEYDDVFGRPHFTNFCHVMTWIPAPDGERIFGYYDKRHNDSN